MGEEEAIDHVLLSVWEYHTLLAHVLQVLVLLDVMDGVLLFFDIMDSGFC